MKRIQTACLHQTIHFQLKDNVPAEIAGRRERIPGKSEPPRRSLPNLE